MAPADHVPEDPELRQTTEATAVSDPLTARVSDEIVTGVQRADRSDYAGFNWVAGLLGFAVAMFFLAVFLGAVEVVLGALGYRPVTGSLTAMVSAPGMQGGAAGTLVAIILAYLIGGYAAGRLARYDGARNGLGVVLWTVIVAAAVAIAGVVLRIRGQLAQFVPIHLGLSVSATHIIAGVVAGVVALVLMIAAALTGGALGMRYHRRIDRAVGVIA